ncbi:MAG: hypothetical protein ACFCBW_04885 [Candidatus Competibacterales bacterium]
MHINGIAFWGALLLAGHPTAFGQTLYFFSEAGDYIGQGQTQTWHSAGGQFTARRNFDQGVTVGFDSADGRTWWTLDFAAPDEGLLTVGVYPTVARFPFQDPGQAGLSVSGSGRGCNTVQGQFEVLDVSYGVDGAVEAFAADFEQHCGGDDAALFGSVRINSPLPVTTGATALYFDSESGDYIGQGEERTWTEQDGDFAAGRNFDAGVTIDFDGVDPGRWWTLDFAAVAAEPLMRGPYEGATRFPFQTPQAPGLSVSGSGRGCNTLEGRFDVLEAEYAADGGVERFAADFEQYCDNSLAPLRGAVRYNSFEDIAAPTVLYFASEAGDYIGQGEENTWRRSTGRFTAEVNFDNGITVDYDDDAPGTWWTLSFAAPGEVPLEVGVYRDASRFPFQGAAEPGLSVSGSGRGCNALDGSFDVLEVSYGADGGIESFAVDFEQQCDNSVGLLRGSLRFNSQLPVAVDSTPVEEVITPWQTHAKGNLITDLPWNYVMGYAFTPEVPGEITHIGGFFNGTKTVRLFDAQSWALLAETPVTAANTWAYGDIAPVAVEANRRYVVAVYLAGSGGSFRYNIDPLPQVYPPLRIDATVYNYTGNEPAALPLYSITGRYMYGQADVKFVPLP